MASRVIATPSFCPRKKRGTSVDAVNPFLQRSFRRFTPKYLLHTFLLGCLKLPTWLPKLSAEHIAKLKIWVRSLREEERMDLEKQPAGSIPPYVTSKPGFYIQTLA